MDVESICIAYSHERKVETMVLIKLLGAWFKTLTAALNVASFGSLKSIVVTHNLLKIAVICGRRPFRMVGGILWPQFSFASRNTE